MANATVCDHVLVSTIPKAGTFEVAASTAGAYESCTLDKKSALGQENLEKCQVLKKDLNLLYLADKTGSATCAILRYVLKVDQ